MIYISAHYTHVHHVHSCVYTLMFMHMDHTCTCAYTLKHMHIHQMCIHPVILYTHGSWCIHINTHKIKIHMNVYQIYVWICWIYIDHHLPIKGPSRMKNRSWFALGTCARWYIHTWTICISGDSTRMHQIH